ncbi:MAG: hypothetical protein ACK45K_09150, partial [Burkholderiaceae bacterium]
MSIQCGLYQLILTIRSRREFAITLKDGSAIATKAKNAESKRPKEGLPGAVEVYLRGLTDSRSTIICIICSIIAIRRSICMCMPIMPVIPAPAAVVAWLVPVIALGEPIPAPPGE